MSPRCCAWQSEIEDLIWEVDEDCDRAVVWQEFQHMYQRCNKDTAGARLHSMHNAT